MQDDNQQGEEKLSIGKASEYLGVSVDTLRRWEKKGKVTTSRSPGGHRYFLKSDLEKVFGQKYKRALKEESPKVEEKPTVTDTTPPDSKLPEPTASPADQTPSPLPSSEQDMVEPVQTPSPPLVPTESHTLPPVEPTVPPLVTKQETKIPETPLIKVTPEDTTVPEPLPVIKPSSPEPQVVPQPPIQAPQPEPGVSFRDVKEKPTQTDKKPLPFRVETVETTEIPLERPLTQPIAEPTPQPSQQDRGPSVPETPPSLSDDQPSPVSLEVDEKSPIAVEPKVATDKKNGKLHRTASFLLVVFVTINIVLLAIYIYLSRFA